MQKTGIVILAAVLLLQGCDFFIVPDRPAGKSSLTIRMGNNGPDARSVTPISIMGSLEYLITATKGKESVTITIAPGETTGTMTVSPGVWDIIAEAYLPSGPVHVGTGSIQATAISRQTTSVDIPMKFDNTDITLITAVGSDNVSYPPKLVNGTTTSYEVSVPPTLTNVTIAAVPAVADADVSYSLPGGVVSSFPGSLTVTVDAALNYRTEYTVTVMLLPTAASWSELVSAIASAPSGNTTIYIIGSFDTDTAVSGITIPTGKTITLLAAGGNQTITRGASFTADPLFTVGTGGTLILGEASDDNLVLDGNNVTAHAAMVKVNANGTLDMRGSSKITRNINDQTSGDANGGGVYVSGTGSSLVMSDYAEISYNKATAHNPSTAYFTHGGGVYVSGTFTMNDNAKISDNIAANTADSKNNSDTCGGGVYVSGTFTMNDNAKISDNNTESITSSHTFGGGVYLFSGTFTMNDNAEISDNTATTITTADGTDVTSFLFLARGGGVHASGTFTMNKNAKISGNTAKGTNSPTSSGNNILSASEGGGVYVSGTFTMNDNAEISSNTADGVYRSHGGGVYKDSGTFIMNGSVKISSNTANNSNNRAQGGGVFVNSGTFIMNAGTISGGSDTDTNSLAGTGTKEGISLYKSNGSTTTAVYGDTASTPIISGTQTSILFTDNSITGHM
ncbi:hypothetical protein LQZ19_18200 [Treponema primitia]|uniref:hypothetical protein n=1 Tax=Treponema primitia TaxID=88058 RepID=UPI003980DE79